MRKSLVPLLALGALVLPSTALAGDDPPVTPAPPEFAPPAPAPVTDTASAGAFAKLYVSQQAGRLSRSPRERVRVLNVESSCLQAPFLDTRFGCVFTVRAAIISRRGGWNYDRGGHYARASKSGGGDRRGHRNRRFRVSIVGCLGALRVDGGPTATPTATLQALECRRIQREDREVVAPVDD